MTQPSPGPVAKAKPSPAKRPDLLAGHEKLAALLALAVLFAALIVSYATLPDVRQLTKNAPGNSIQIFDREGQLVVTIDGDEEREFVALRELPKVVQQSLIAAEDHNFYRHRGISYRGILRAVLNNAGAGRVVEGGSTITQQLAKNLFFGSGERSLLRKIREAVLALQIEHEYSKKEIMEMYLNRVYFGRGAYGLERAAKRYFGKSSRALTLPEAAYLAGLLKAPSHFGDPKNAAAARDRQHLVLEAMQDLELLTPRQVERAKKSKLVFSRSTARMTKFPYYVSAVQESLRAAVPAKILAGGGLRVFTNLDQTAQRLAEHTLAQHVSSKGGGMNQAALVSVLVEDSSVVALVGGAGDYWKHQYNSATGPHTTGSAFKPFVYLTGFMQGKFTPESIIDDSPIMVPQPDSTDWQPKNFDGEYYGQLSIREAIALSRNIPAVRAGLAAGLGHVVETAHAAGISSELIATPALALGASAASPLDMAGAYATIARAGICIPPSLVRRVEGANGYCQDFKMPEQRLFPENPVRALISCLESVVKEGTGIGARLPGRPVAGKTGTSDEAKDLWFVGFTPHMVTAVWGGNDQHHSLGRLTGGTVLTGIWRAYNQGYYKTHKIPPAAFPAEDLSKESSADGDKREAAAPAPGIIELSPSVPLSTGDESSPLQPPQDDSALLDNDAGDRRIPAQEPHVDAEQNQPPPGFAPLPGRPQPGRVRQRPVIPPATEPSEPRRYFGAPAPNDVPQFAPYRQPSPDGQTPQITEPAPDTSPDFRQLWPAAEEGGGN